MAARVLVTYGTKHGATAEIAEAIADAIRGRGAGADCMPAGQAPDDLSGYDAVVLGSAVYMKRWRRDARRFLRQHGSELAARPLWVFSSGPVGETKPNSGWEEPPRTISQVERLGAREHVVFGGRVPTHPSGFIERSIARRTPAALADRRDWEEIRAWGTRIADELARPAERPPDAAAP